MYRSLPPVDRPRSSLEAARCESHQNLHRSRTRTAHRAIMLAMRAMPERTPPMIASAPGKLILTGEYAVLDGAPAIVVAVDRRAIARRNATPRGSSPFLVAVAEEIAARRGETDPAARAALEVSVDSTAFYHRASKLGLGSSAAVTVAATALALEQSEIATTNRREILAIALAAHARAQGPRGARGSGADIAASVYGGTIAFSRPAGTRPWLIEPMRWAGPGVIVPVFTGVSPHTPQLGAPGTPPPEAPPPPGRPA